MVSVKCPFTRRDTLDRQYLFGPLQTKIMAWKTWTSKVHGPSQPMPKSRDPIYRVRPDLTTHLPLFVCARPPTPQCSLNLNYPAFRWLVYYFGVSLNLGYGFSSCAIYVIWKKKKLRCVACLAQQTQRDHVVRPSRRRSRRRCRHAFRFRSITFVSAQ